MPILKSFRWPPHRMAILTTVSNCKLRSLRSLVILKDVGRADDFVTLTTRRKGEQYVSDPETW
jgi:hypothetical protein